MSKIKYNADRLLYCSGFPFIGNGSQMESNCPWKHSMRTMADRYACPNCFNKIDHPSKIHVKPVEDNETDMDDTDDDEIVSATSLTEVKPVSPKEDVKKPKKKKLPKGMSR